MAVSNQATDQIDRAAVAGVLDLRNVLELVNDCFYNRPFTEEELVGQGHQAVFHIGFEFSDELEAKGLEEVEKKGSGEIACVGKHFTKEIFDQAWHRLAVVDIAWGQDEIEQLAAVVENQVQFEAEEPAGRRFTPSG